MNCECEVVDMIKQLQFDKDALLEELIAKRNRLAELAECYSDALTERDELKEKMKRLNETNEDLANKLAAARAETERVTDAWNACSELRDSINEKIVELKHRFLEQDKEIVELKHRVLEQDKEIVYKQELIDEVCDKNRWLNDQIDAKNKRIQELCRPIAIPEKEPTIRPFDELPYVRYARHIRMKYKALVDNGFSHDDAMALIPMWDDNEFESFKRDGFRAAVTFVDEMHKHKEG